MQNGRMHVGHVMAVFDRVEADLIGGPVDDAALDPAAGQPDREAVNVMVPSIGTL